METKTKIDKKESVHYVNNAQFSSSVVDYVKLVNEAKLNNEPIPIIPRYIAECFLRISNGLSHKSNFIRYTYREEMVMDGVENCLKAIMNYNLETATRTGKPNAFAYFTQIVWYAFLRRIAKEKKQQDIKMSYLSKAGTDGLLENYDTGDMNNISVTNFVENLRQRIDRVKDNDQIIKEYAKEEKKKRKSKNVDSDLTDFIGE